MILDITAGNRHLWGGWAPIPEEGPIVFIDVEERLRIPPDILADNRYLPIRDGVAEAVVFDPPHIKFGSSRFFGDPLEREGSWWGNYKNMGNLFRLLAGAVKSSWRALAPGGRLYFKWSDSDIPLQRFITIFTGSEHNPGPFLEEERLERQARSGNLPWGKERNPDNTTYWLRFRRNDK